MFSQGNGEMIWRGAEASLLAARGYVRAAPVSRSRVVEAAGTDIGVPRRVSDIRRPHIGTSRSLPRYTLPPRRDALHPGRSVMHRFGSSRNCGRRALQPVVHETPSRPEQADRIGIILRVGAQGATAHPDHVCHDGDAGARI